MTITTIQAPVAKLRTHAPSRDERMDYDVREIAIGFGEERPQSLSSAECAGYGSTTLGDITYLRIDPLRAPFRVADTRLQSRLEALCETLRARY
jgi:hypothetical protein